jgi:Uncharacterized protein containing SIS (Sugar ISomerase) phosphosugar binding domain
MRGSVKNNRMLYFFGTGHSHMICEEPFYRAGGLVPVRPILESSLMLHEGAHKSTLLERMDGLGKVLLDESGADKGDVLFLISNSGRNGSAIDMALEARAKGIVTIALTSLGHSKAYASRHKSGKKLFEVVDYAIDNCGVPGDAAVEIEHFGQKVAPTSSIACVLIINTIVVNVVERLVAQGITPPVFMSSNTDEGDSYNRTLLQKYNYRLF